MTREEIIEKLRGMGIASDNCYPKNSFIDEDLAEPVVGLFKNELTADFYFYTKFDKTLYVFRQLSDLGSLSTNTHMGKTKYIVPLSKCEVIWSNKPIEEIELPDAIFSTMSLRQYAAIHLKVPNSGVIWLDNLIKESNRNELYNVNT